MLGMRHVQTLLLFLNLSVVYISRLNVAVSIVAMTNANSTNPNFPEYKWTEGERSYIISSFYWGYVLTQFPSGYVTRRFGAKTTMFFVTLITGICSSLVPFSVSRGGWQAYCTLRFIQGLVQGALFGPVCEHLAKWSPESERNRLCALSHSGLDCGSVLSMFLTGMVAASSIGWPGISYVSAGLCFVWCIFWVIFAANNPPKCRFTTHAEVQYIESSLKHAEGFHEKKIPVPWSAILTSMPFYVLMLVRVLDAVGSSIFQAQIPAYMNGVLNMDIKSNAIFSGLPFFTNWVMSYVYVIIADLLVNKVHMSVTNMRKVLNTAAMWIPAVGCFAVGFLSRDQQAWAIALMTINVGVNSGATIGCLIGSIDLSPNHAGVISGVLNGVANLVPLFAPLLVGAIVQDQHNRSQWQIVFISVTCCLFFGNLVYLIWGTSELQPWDAEDFLMPKDIKQLENEDFSVAKINEELKNSEIKVKPLNTHNQKSPL